MRATPIKHKVPDATRSCSYLFEIESARPSYLFGSFLRAREQSFGEYLHPRIDAVCKAPAKLSGRVTLFTLIGDREINRRLSLGELAPSTMGVGTLTMRGTKSEYLGQVPHDAAWQIVSAIRGGAFKFIVLHGAALSNGRARIQSIGFDEKFDPDEI